jgi:Rhodopirellula transposase DDE domain
MMDHPSQQYDDLIRSAAQRLRGHQRRLFQAEVANSLCGGSPRAAERRFGWGRDCVETGLHEAGSGLRCVENFAAKGAIPREVKDPQLAADIRAVVEPHTQADPELKSSRRYTKLSAREVLEALKSQKAYSDDRLPKERPRRDILNRLGYRIKRIPKAKPLKKTKDTDAVVANVRAARQESGDDPETLEISIDTKAKVNEGDDSRGGKKQDRLRGEDARGMGP